MSKFDFDCAVNRRNTGSLKWDVEDGVLPMWVADMDFKTAPAVAEAIEKRAAHGVFGYSIIPDEWNDAYIKWWERRHGLKIEKDWLVFCTGVVPAISSAVRKLTTPAENVLIQTPVYNIFFNSIVNNGRNVVQSPLVYDAESNEYSIDFADLEHKLSDPQTTLMILCNPHNPIGKIWDKTTLARIGELCYEHNVTVLSDEIHCDITAPNAEYTPFIAASEVCRSICVMCVAPTKAFNLAGIQTAAVVVPDKNLRHKVWRALNTDEVAEPNAFAVGAAVAAFTEGGEWLDELRGYVHENKRTVYEFLRSELPQVKAAPSEATYLMWLDCSKVCDDSVELTDFVKKATGLYISNGAQYGGGGKSFVRLNVACPRSVLKDGLNRLKRGIEAYKKRK